MYIITELSTILHRLEHVSYETVGYLHVLLNKKMFSCKWQDCILIPWIIHLNIGILYLNINILCNKYMALYDIVM